MVEILFEELKGKTIQKIIGEIGDDCLDFYLTNDERYRLIYHPDCCAYCSIEDICGDLDDLIGNPILVAEEVRDIDRPSIEKYEESFTWVFYKLDTIKGGVTIRWYGSSNGYYSEAATFEKLIQNDDFYDWRSWIR